MRACFTLHRAQGRRAAAGVLLLVLVTTVVSAAPADHPCGSSSGPDSEASPAERFGCARTLVREKRFDEAGEVYRSLSAQFPDNVDYVFGEAQARFWSGDSKRALEVVSRARQLAPDYEDVWALEFQILAAASARKQRQLGEFRRAARARFPDAEWLKAAEAPDDATWNWESGISRETLDNGAPDWQTLYAHIDRRTPEDGVLSLSVAEHRRFSLSDIEVSAGGGTRFADTWLVDGTLRIAPGADFLPETVIAATIGRILGDGWIAGGGAGRRWYPDDSVNTIGVHVERYFGRFRAALHVDNTRLEEASTFTYRSVLDYFADSGSRYGLAVAAGDEVEVIAPGRLLDMDISAVALSGRHPIRDRLSVTWRVGTHRQGSLYRRNHFGLSIAGEF